jgi:PIN domain nuclease of toxin-antitoxin system
VIQAIADTHTIIWYLLADPRLSANARTTIDAAATANAHIGVSSISLVELVYLQEKGRIGLTLLASVLAELRRPGAVLVEVPVEAAIVQTMTRLPQSEVPELADRVIGATALHFGVPLLTRDTALTHSTVPTLW